ncbi:MAG: hypothetical protein ACJARX_002015 [Psychroserpens sp.]|jgi:hypothetical protein
MLVSYSKNGFNLELNILLKHVLKNDINHEFLVDFNLIWL